MPKQRKQASAAQPGSFQQLLADVAALKCDVSEIQSELEDKLPDCAQWRTIKDNVEATANEFRIRGLEQFAWMTARENLVESELRNLDETVTRAQFSDVALRAKVYDASKEIAEARILAAGLNAPLEQNLRHSEMHLENMMSRERRSE